MARILAIDLGKFKSTACDFNSETNEHMFCPVRTRPQAIHDLIAERSPDRVVIEVGSQAGWIQDMCQEMGVEVQVANPNHEGWRWKNVKRKTDRDDALKLAKLSAVGQLPMINLPSREVRQWRALVEYRAKLVCRRTAIKNSIRSVLDRQGLTMPAGWRGWACESLEELRALSRPMGQVDIEDLWRGRLAMELAALDQIEALIEEAEKKLDRIGAADKRVRLLRTIPGVGARLAETVVAVIDDPKRFESRRAVAAYVGLVPRQFESGTMNRTGRITGSGNRLLRALLIEVGWMACRYNPQIKGIFEQTCRGTKSRRKIAVVATARRLLIICWAMLRDNKPWRVVEASAA
jgi:transposase